MRGRLIGSYLLLVAVALVVFTVPVGLSLAALLDTNQEEVGLREARTVAVLLGTVQRGSGSGVGGGTAALETLRTALEEQTGGRVELLDARGEPALGRPVSRTDDPTLRAALAGHDSVRRLDDSVLGEPGLEVVVPAPAADGTLAGAVRLTYPTAPVTAQIVGVWTFRAIAAAVTLGLAALLAAALARRFSRPLHALDGMAARLSSGDFTVRSRLPDGTFAEARRLGATLERGARQLGTLVESQRVFVADASHQLRSPLTALRLSLDNLQDGLTDPADRRSADRAIAETVRMTRLVNDLLALAKAESELAHPAPVDVAAVVDGRLASWAAAAEEHDVRLVAGVPAVIALVTPGHLEQVIDNVLDNALRAAPPGTAVRVDGAAEPDTVRLVISDAGPGMDEKDRSRAFDRFWRGRPGGTGLGLAIVRQLVQENAGRISLGPGPAGGLAVTVVLPRHR